MFCVIASIAGGFGPEKGRFEFDEGILAPVSVRLVRNVFPGTESHTAMQGGRHVQALTVCPTRSPSDVVKWHDIRGRKTIKSRAEREPCFRKKPFKHGTSKVGQLQLKTRYVEQQHHVPPSDLHAKKILS